MAEALGRVAPVRRIGTKWLDTLRLAHAGRTDFIADYGCAFLSRLRILGWFWDTQPPARRCLASQHATRRPHQSHDHHLGEHCGT